MPNYWLMKTEPGTYSFADLERDGTTRWDGVSNAAALGHIRGMRKGDSVFIYHSGDEKQVVGIAQVIKDPYADPKLKDPRLVVVDLQFSKKIKNPVTLAAIKGDPRFKEFHLVRISRLSVMPVTAVWWKAILAMAQ